MEAAAPSISRSRPLLGLTARHIFALSAGIGALVCAILAQHPSDRNFVPSWVYVVTLLAIVLAAVSLPLRVAPALQLVAGSDRLQQVGTIAGIVLIPTLVALGVWNREPFAATHRFNNASSTWAAVLWLACMAAGLFYAWGTRGGRTAAHEQPNAQRGRSLLSVEMAALAIILIGAAALRIWHLGSLPEGIWTDEVDDALGATRMLHAPFQPLLLGDLDNNPSLYFYLMTPLVGLFGNTIAIVRMASVLFGLVATLAVYLIGRRIGGAALGLCAAALMGMAQWAIDFSRIGMPNISAPAMLGLSFAALAVSMQRPRAFWFLLTGLLLGLTILAYQGGLLPAASVGAGVIGFRLITGNQFRRAAWPGLLLLPIGFIVGAAPFLIALHLDYGFTTIRQHQVSIFTEYPDRAQWLPAIQENLRRHILMFTVAGDSNGRHNLPGAPMIDAVTGTCLLLGLGMCLRTIHRWYSQLLIIWLVAAMLGGILSLDFEAPQGARTIAAVAPIALIAALPLMLLGQIIWMLLLALPEWIERRRGQRSPSDQVARPRNALVATLLASVVVAGPLAGAYARNTNQYFNQQATDFPSWAAMNGDQAITGRAIPPLVRQGFTVFVDPSVAHSPSLVYAANNINAPAYDPSVPVPPLVPNGGLALIIPMDNTSTFSYVHNTYPLAQVIPLTANFDKSAIRSNIVLIRSADVQRNIGVNVSFGTGSILTHQLGSSEWPAGSTAKTAASIQGTLLISTDQSVQPISLRVVGAKRSSIQLDGQLTRDGNAGTTPASLGAGNHALLVQATGKAGESLSLQWNIAGSWMPIPAISLGVPTLPSGGLQGAYYNSPDFTGPVAMTRVDPVIHYYYQIAPPHTGFPFSVRWSGTLRIDLAGSYGFELDSQGPSQFFVDGQPVLAQAGGNGPVQVAVTLAQGIHRIRLDYHGTGGYLHCYLDWAPLGQQFMPLPQAVTEPLGS